MDGPNPQLVPAAEGGMMMRRQKRSTPTKEQQAAISAAGLNPHVWTCLKELSQTLIIRNRLDGTVRLIDKQRKENER